MKAAAKNLRLVVTSFAALLVGIALALGLLYWRAPEARAAKVGRPAPEIALPSLGGRGMTRLSGFRGHPVLLFRFRGDCATCARDLAYLERIHRRYMTRGLVVIGVSADTRDATEALVRGQNVTFFILEDPGGRAMAAAYGARVFPEAYLIDSQGNAAGVYTGPVDWVRGEVRQRLIGLLSPPKPGAW